MNSGAAIMAEEAAGSENGSKEIATVCRLAIAKAMITAAIGNAIRSFRNFAITVSPPPR